MARASHLKDNLWVIKLYPEAHRYILRLFGWRARELQRSTWSIGGWPKTSQVGPYFHYKKCSRVWPEQSHQNFGCLQRHNRASACATRCSKKSIQKQADERNFKHTKQRRWVLRPVRCRVEAILCRDTKSELQHQCLSNHSSKEWRPYISSSQR